MRRNVDLKRYFFSSWEHGFSVPHSFAPAKKAVAGREFSNKASVGEWNPHHH